MKGAHLWVNMNHDFSYNVIHSHPGADLIVLYYPLYEGQEQGELHLVRTDGCVHVKTYNGTELAMEHVPNIEEGYLLLFHHIFFIMLLQTCLEEIEFLFLSICLNKYLINNKK